MLSRNDTRTFLPLAVVILLMLSLLPVVSGCSEDDQAGSEYDDMIADLASEDEAERQQAIDALVQAGEPAVEPVIAVFVGDVQTLEALKGANSVLEQIAGPAVEPLVESLAYTGDKSATALAWKKNTLAAIGEPAVDPLIVALTDDSAVVRIAAADTLGKIGDARAVEPLARALSDEDAVVRETTAEAMGTIADPRGIPSLTEALGDEKRDVRKAVRKALADIHAAVGEDPQLQAAFEKCVAVEVLPITDPYGLVIDEFGVMENPEVLYNLADDDKLFILKILGDCVLINQ